MGLREDIQTDIAEAFDGDLADAVNPFSVYRLGPSYDTATGQTADWELIGSGRGVLTAADVDVQDDASNKYGYSVLALLNEIDVVIYIQDQLEYAGLRYVIQDTIVDPAQATITLYMELAQP